MARNDSSFPLQLLPRSARFLTVCIHFSFMGASTELSCWKGKASGRFHQAIHCRPWGQPCQPPDHLLKVWCGSNNNPPHETLKTYMRTTLILHIHHVERHRTILLHVALDTYVQCNTNEANLPLAIGNNRIMSH